MSSRFCRAAISISSSSKAFAGTDARQEADIRLHVKVVPGSSRTGIAGWLGDTLKVRVTAPPERGKANSAVCATIAQALGIAAGQVEVVAGHASARKIVEIKDLRETEIVSRLPIRR